MKKLSLQNTLTRIIITVVVVVVLFFVALGSMRIIKNTAIKQSPSNFLYVSQKTNPLAKADGSIFTPFPTVAAAIKKSQFTNQKKIFIDDGWYTEQLILTPGIELYGSKDVSITNPKGLMGETIKLSTRNLLYNLKVRGGRRTIAIPPDSFAALIKVDVANASNYVLYTELSSQINASNLLITHSHFSHAKKQGLYLQKGTVTIKNSIVTQNGEEGIDLHHSMNATIQKNQLTKNGESGLETEIDNNTVSIIENIIEGNNSNGVNAQTGESVGFITIQDNIIRNNDKFGVRCAIHSKKPPAPRPYFPNTVIIQENQISENGINNQKFDELDTEESGQEKINRNIDKNCLS